MRATRGGDRRNAPNCRLHPESTAVSPSPHHRLRRRFPPLPLARARGCGRQPLAAGSPEGRTTRQAGAAAIEFAFIFPILLLLVYGAVVYGYVFFLSQSVNYAAQQAAEAAMSVDPADPDAVALRQQRISQTVARSMSWMSDGQRSQRLTICNSGDCPQVDDTLTVTLRFNLSTPSRMFPVVQLPGMGSLPPLPDTLTASAAALMQ